MRGEGNSQQKSSKPNNRMKPLVLCIDIGSSSARCSLYSLPNEESKSIQAVGEPVSASWEVIHPTTGRIQLQQQQQHPHPHPTQTSNRSSDSIVDVFEILDGCIDEVLQRLPSGAEIVAIGFSSLVMNLVGVDANGKPVGQEATLSYACNLPQVALKTKELQT